MSRGPLKLYGSYVFRTKDPVIDELRTFVQAAYGTKRKGVYKDIQDNGGPSATTIYNWFHGKTKRPQSASIEAAGRALGMKRVWVLLTPESSNGKKKKKKKKENGK